MSITRHLVFCVSALVLSCLLATATPAQTPIPVELQPLSAQVRRLLETLDYLGAPLAAADKQKLEQALAEYGMHLGTAFQLIDDVLDYSGDLNDTGKNLGDDLAEGKPTLPLIHAQREGNAEQRAAIRDAIEHGGRDNLDRVVAALNATGALDYARQAAHREADRAADAIAGLTDSVYREALLQLCVFAVERRH